jgi:hypothetical protein
VYTAALINELTNPSGAIESIFKRVRFKVRQRTGGKQIPWESSSLEKEFYFTEPRSGQVPDPIEAFKQELIQWNLIAESKDVKVFYEFIDKYPFGLFSEKAQAKIERFSSSSAVRPIGTQAFSVVPAGRPLYNIGDRFVYRSVDVNGKPQSNRDLLVTAITASTVELNGGQEVWDWTGNLITSGVNPRITRVPAKLWIPAELYIGKKWRTAYTATSKEGASTLFWDFFVESLEKLNISAGAFQAYRVTGTSVVSNGATQTETLWIDASTFLIVKDIWQRQRSIRGEERIEASYNQELTQVFKAQTR